MKLWKSNFENKQNFKVKIFKFRPGQIALIFPFLTFLKLFHANVDILYRHWIYSIIINQYSQL